MKIIPKSYMCEVCYTKYDTPQEAIACESQSVPEYPIGMIYGDNREGAFYKGIVFAVAGNRIEQHWNSISNWDCRADSYGVGDSLGDAQCGTGSGSRLTEHDAHVNTKSPEFFRMVEYLEDEGYDIIIWDGEKPVPLNDYLKALEGKNGNE
jgi:hypothetical protein